MKLCGLTNFLIFGVQVPNYSTDIAEPFATLTIGKCFKKGDKVCAVSCFIHKNIERLETLEVKEENYT